MNWRAHLKTVNHHRRLVRKHCFRVGLYWQGLTHDLSKYSPTEFLPGAKYYQGYRSPINQEREELGVSKAWLHHKGRNKHHLEYWIDYSTKPGEGMIGMEMPARYVAEMVCDRMAASKTYLKENYHNGAPYEYFMSSKEHYMVHPKTKALLEKILLMLRDEGEEATFAYVKKELVGK